MSKRAKYDKSQWNSDGKCHADGCNKLARTSGLCGACYQQTRVKKDPKRFRVIALRNTYGPAAPAHWDSRFEQQRGVCALCHRSKRLVQDHNHNTDQLRSLLCHRCNAAVGYYELYDQQLLAQYVASWNGFARKS